MKAPKKINGYQTGEIPDESMDRRDFLKYSLVGIAGAVISSVLPGCSPVHKNDIITNKPFQKQAYLDDGFLEYPSRLGKACDKYWAEGKPVEWILTETGLVLAFANDVIELPASYIVGLAGGAIGGEKGRESWSNFVKYVADGIPGGETYNEFHGKLLSGDVKGAFELADNVEDSKVGALMKKGIILGSNVAIAASLINHGGGGGAATSRARSAPSGPPF